MNRNVLVLVDDLFWRSKIDHAVKSAQREAEFSSDPSAALASADPARHYLVLVDLALKKSPFDAVAAMKRDPARSALAVVGFYEHVRKDLKEKGETGGFDKVLPRSAFSEKLADILLEFALPGSARVASEEVELPEE